MSRRAWVGGVLVSAMVIWPSVGVMAAEHGGQEHGGKEHGGATTQEHGGQAAPAPAGATGGPGPAAATSSKQAMPALEPSAEQIRQAIRDYITGIEREEDAFTIEDEMTGDIRTLALVQVHERVGKAGDAYYSCTDMKDAASGEILDLDFDVTSEDGILDVVDVRIHKVNDEARYTYDDQDNRIPLM